MKTSWTTLVLYTGTEEQGHIGLAVGGYNGENRLEMKALERKIAYLCICKKINTGVLSLLAILEQTILYTLPLSN